MDYPRNGDGTALGTSRLIFMSVGATSHTDRLEQIPMLWHWFIDDNNSNRLEAVARFEQKKTAAKQDVEDERARKEADKKKSKTRKKSASASHEEHNESTSTSGTGSKPKAPPKPKLLPDDKYTMHSGDVDHFLLLSDALHLLLRNELTTDSLDMADALLRKYCGEIALVSYFLLICHLSLRSS